MKKVVLFILIPVWMFAQAGNENVSYSGGLFFTRANRPTNTEYKIDGTPYIDGKGFKKAMVDGYGKDIKYMRYNAYEDEIEFEQNGTVYFVNKEDGLTVRIPEINKVYQALKYKLNGRTYFGYLVLLFPGSKVSLYKKEKVELLKGEKSPNAYGKGENDYFVKAKDLYLQGDKGKIDVFPKSTKDAIRLFSPLKKGVYRFIDEEKIRFNKEDGVVKLIEFLNQ
ncbi:hypothetical protein CMU93_09785 [Elizabethkingia anophelis]|nr:hypothetical protein [Elizabethkingia anophelis]